MLEGLTPPSKDKLCLVAEWVATLDKNDVAIFVDALADSRWSTTALHNELCKRGLKVGYTVFQKHRTGNCSCSKD